MARLPAQLPATSSEKARTSSWRVRLITQVYAASVKQNIGEGTAESYRWSIAELPHCPSPQDQNKSVPHSEWQCPTSGSIKTFASKVLESLTALYQRIIG